MINTQRNFKKVKKTNDPNEKKGNNPESSQKKRKIINKCLFKRFNILSNWEIQVTVCLHLLSARIVMIKKIVNNCWQICWWDCKPAQPLCKVGWVILKKLIYHLTQLYHASEYAKRTWHPAPQIPAQLCPLLLYSQ